MGCAVIYPLSMKMLSLIMIIKAQSSLIMTFIQTEDGDVDEYNSDDHQSEDACTIEHSLDLCIELASNVNIGDDLEYNNFYIDIVPFVAIDNISDNES